MKKILLLLLLSLPTAIWAQGTLGLRLDGGVSLMGGGGPEGARGNATTITQPQIGAGLFYNFSPIFRLGLDYSYTRMLREQTNASLESQPDGSVQGNVYYDFKTNFHGIALTGEMELLTLLEGKKQDGAEEPLESN